MEILNYTLFTIGHDTPVLLIDLITSIIGLTCVFLAGRNSKYNFYVGYLYTAMLFFLFYNKNLYANMILQPISLAINIYGHYRWTHPKENEKSSSDSSALKVSMLNWKQRIFFIALVFVCAGLWGWLIRSLGDPVPYLDACVAVLILVSQLLSAMKKWDCWIGWLLVNVTQMIMHISVGHIFMPVVSGLYLVNGIISIRHWYKLYKNKA